MSGNEWIVLAGGIGAIVWVNWYFFFAERRAAAIRGLPDSKTAEK